jgi:2-isopropylmalate synthase
MHMAVACAAAAVREGAVGVKCTVLPNGFVTMEELAKFVQVKGNDYDIMTQVRTTELHRSVMQLKKILEPEEEEVSRFSNIGLGDIANVCLDQNDDIAEVIKVVRQMGYDLSEEDNAKVYESFKRVAAKKHFVGTKELDAIIASTAMEVPATYQIVNYVINSGNVITATANLLLSRNGEEVRGVGIGDGPIDAAFQAIEQVIGHHYELDDFQIQTVTEGRDAMGSALVKLRAGGRVYSGNGISTDIIGASIRAYISALNKIVYEEG